jgi:hypothetical protein
MNPKQRERLRAAAQQQTASQRKEKDRYYDLQKEVSDDIRMRDAIIKEELAKSISYVPTPKQKRKEAQIEKTADILVEEIKKSSARKMASPVTVYQQRLAYETPRTTSDASTSSEGVPGRSAYLYAKSTSPEKPRIVIHSSGSSSKKASERLCLLRPLASPLPFKSLFHR